MAVAEQQQQKIGKCLKLLMTKTYFCHELQLKTIPLEIYRLYHHIYEIHAHILAPRQVNGRPYISKWKWNLSLKTIYFAEKKDAHE